MIVKTCWPFPTYCCSPHQVPVLIIHEPKALVDRHAAIANIGVTMWPEHLQVDVEKLKEIRSVA